MNDVSQFINEIFPFADLTAALANLHTSDFLQARAILTSPNDDVDTINSTILDSRPHQTLGVYPSYHSLPVNADQTTTKYCTNEYMLSVVIADIQPPTLRICSGIIMMLLRTINVPVGLCNDTRVIVCRHTRNQVTVLVLKA